jgi:hypothetical protein
MFHQFAYVGKDFAADMDKVDKDPIIRFWWTFCEPCQEPLHWSGPPPSQGGKGEPGFKGQWWSPMKMVTHAGGWSTSWSSSWPDPSFVPKHPNKLTSTKDEPPSVHNRTGFAAGWTSYEQEPFDAVAFAKQMAAAEAWAKCHTVDGKWRPTCGEVPCKQRHLKYCWVCNEVKKSKCTKTQCLIAMGKPPKKTPAKSAKKAENAELEEKPSPVAMAVDDEAEAPPAEAPVEEPVVIPAEEAPAAVPAETPAAAVSKPDSGASAMAVDSLVQDAKEID